MDCRFRREEEIRDRCRTGLVLLGLALYGFYHAVRLDLAVKPAGEIPIFGTWVIAVAAGAFASLVFHPLHNRLWRRIILAGIDRGWPRRRLDWCRACCHYPHPAIIGAGIAGSVLLPLLGLLLLMPLLAVVGGIGLGAAAGMMLAGSNPPVHESAAQIDEQRRRDLISGMIHDPTGRQHIHLRSKPGGSLACEDDLAELQRRLDAGDISAEEYQLSRRMVLGQEGLMEPVVRRGRVNQLIARVSPSRAG